MFFFSVYLCVHTVCDFCVNTYSMYMHAYVLRVHEPLCWLDRISESATEPLVAVQRARKSKRGGE